MSDYPTLTPDQEAALLAPLEPAMVRKDPNRNNYIPAWYVRKRLNEVFGPSRWSATILSWDLVAETSGMRRKRNKKGEEYGEPYEAWTVIYSATMRLEVRDRTTNAVVSHWDDGAIGAQQGVPNRADAHDSALKSALSGALKRCAVNPGIGLSLYDNGSLGWDDHEPAESSRDQADELRDTIRLLAEDKGWPLADVAGLFLTQMGEDIRTAGPEALTTFLASIRYRTSLTTSTAGGGPDGEAGEPSVAAGEEAIPPTSSPAPSTPGAASAQTPAPGRAPNVTDDPTAPGLSPHEYRPDQAGRFCWVPGCGWPKDNPLHITPGADDFRTALLAATEKSQVTTAMRQLEMRSLGEETVGDANGEPILLRDLASRCLKNLASA